MRYREARAEGRSGAAAAELAIWLPFLGLMFVVALDFCRVYYCTQIIQNCAAVGAMYASGASAPNPSVSNPAVQAAIAEGVSLNPPLSASNVTVTYPSGMANVTVTYTFPFLTKLPGLTTSTTITRNVQMASVPQPGN